MSEEAAQPPTQTQEAPTETPQQGEPTAPAQTEAAADPAVDVPTTGDAAPPAEAPAPEAQPADPQPPAQSESAAAPSEAPPAAPDAPVAAVEEAVEIVDAEATLAVRFNVRPEGFYFVQNFPPRAPAIVLYNRMESQFHLERRNVRLYWEGRPLTDMDIIADVCALPDDGLPLMIDVEFDLLPPHLRILTPGEQAQKSLKVDVDFGDDIPPKKFFVTVVKGYDRKPFLGGYRHKQQDAVYHHATTQSYVERVMRRDGSNKLSRTTQTQGVTRSCQTRRECATQMARSDLLVDETYDRKVVAKPYFSADQLIALQIQKTIQLQAYVRGWRARKIARKLRQERDEEEDLLRLEDAARKTSHQEKRMKEIDRRTHPRTAEDFAVLHNELEAWRLQEVTRIKEADITEAEKKVATMELLRKQTKLLQTIDRLQIQAGKENRVRRINTVLNKMSSAKSWGTKSAVNVETPFTIRARELRDLYNGLQLSGLSIDERLDILLHVKWTVKEFECPLTREIVELVDREADLLNRGRKDSSLASLRSRMSNLFLQFIETPEFNPEAIQYQRVPLEFTSRPLVRLDKK